MVNIDKIKALAKEKGVSITFLCQAIGQGAYYFNDVKRRNGSIPEDRLTVIADLLDTTIDYLTDKTDQKEKPASDEVDIDKMLEVLLSLPREKKEEFAIKFMQMMKDGE